MKDPIIIVGSGFAAYQLIKTIRRTDKSRAISVFTLDAGDDYNKPDLSHIFTNKQSSKDLIRVPAEKFAIDNNIKLYPFSYVESIDTDKQEICVKGIQYPYEKLVLATGAKTFIPPMQGGAFDEIITLNSLSEYEQAELTLQNANRVLVIGAGLIGTEIAMDLATSGKSVIVVDPSKSLMASMLPDIVSNTLQKKMLEEGIIFELGQTINSIDRVDSKICATLSSKDKYTVDCVISAAGLKPNIELAKSSGLSVNIGIVVDDRLQTSIENIYALGDCAEINSKVMAYLQPIMLSANALAKTLLGVPTNLKLPAMLVKVKTPLMPIQLGGNSVLGASSWELDIDLEGSSMKSYNEQKEMVGFVVTQGHMKNAFPLLRALPAML